MKELKYKKKYSVKNILWRHVYFIFFLLITIKTIWYINRWPTTPYSVAKFLGILGNITYNANWQHCIYACLLKVFNFCNWRVRQFLFKIRSYMTGTSLILNWYSQKYFIQIFDCLYKYPTKHTLGKLWSNFYPEILNFKLLRFTIWSNSIHNFRFQ